MSSRVAVRMVVFGSALAFVVSVVPVVASTPSLDAVVSERPSVAVTATDTDPVADTLSISVIKRGESVYLNASDLLDGDLSVETDGDGLIRARGVGTLTPTVGESARFEVDVVRRGSQGRYRYTGFLRLRDGSYRLISRLRVRDVELTSAGTVVVEWFDTAKKLDISMTVEDSSVLGASGCPSSSSSSSSS